MRSVTTTLVILLLVAATRPAASQPERPLEHEYSDLWTGTFWGPGVIGGPATLANEPLSSTLGYAMGAKFSTAVILTAVHLQLAYLHSQFNAESQGDPFELTGDSVSLSLGLHPGFLLNLYGPGQGYFAASVYLQLGVSAEFATIDWRDQSLDESWIFGFHMGAGFDYPIDSPDDGAAFWIGANYRWNRLSLDLAPLDPAGRLSDESTLRQHLFLLRISYRVNGMLF